MFKAILFFVFISLYSFTGLHDFHISKSEIKFSEKSQSVQISVHVFIDDLESCLAKDQVIEQFIGTANEKETADEHISNYIKKHLQFRLGEEILSADFIGKELSEELVAVWCYLEIPNIESCEDLKLRNTIFLEQFEDQKNLVFFSTDEGNKDYFTYDIEDIENTFACE